MGHVGIDRRGVDDGAARFHVRNGRLRQVEHRVDALPAPKPTKKVKRAEQLGRHRRRSVPRRLCAATITRRGDLLGKPDMSRFSGGSDVGWWV
jgi:hypothetical protein